jgi:hypothetical protein
MITYKVLGYNKANPEMGYLYAMHKNRKEAFKDLNILKTEGVMFDRYCVDKVTKDLKNYFSEGMSSPFFTSVEESHIVIKSVHAQNYWGHK